MSTSNETTKIENFRDLIKTKIEAIRPKLLDLSRRNPLISTSFSLRSSSIIRVVDELPEVLAYHLRNQQAMRFFPLPPLENDPKDEQSDQFQTELSNARFTDEIYLSTLKKLNPKNDQHIEEIRQVERDLKDRIRASLGMAPRQKKNELSMQQHAINNKISPHYDLPNPHDENEDGRHRDENIQTLFLPEDLERKLNALMTKCRTWEQETGINVLHVAFGFLEWTEPNNPDSAFAPLVLLPVKLEKRKTRTGNEFWVTADGDDLDTNFVIAEKMRNDFGIILPRFQQGGSIEEFFQEMTEVAPQKMKWKVRRQVAFGVFPSARMTMYADLDCNKHDFGKNEIISDLLGGIGSYTTPFADEYEVDNPDIESKVPYLVLDADASQFSAIVDAVDGKNIALEGPPGTGKSQTIVNTIAVAMAQGKKVLFVAEKMAALEVVKSRLEAIGLGEFLLPLQATRSSREQVIGSIRKRLEMDIPAPIRDYDTKIQQFKNIRADLAIYIDIISGIFGKTGLTLYEIIGKSIASSHVLINAPKRLQSLQITEIENFDAARIDIILNAGHSVETAWNEVSKSQSYWRNLMIPYLDPFKSSEILQLAQDLGLAFEISSQNRVILEDYGIKSTESSTDISSLAQSTNEIIQILPYVNQDMILKAHRSSNFEAIVKFSEQCKLLQAEIEHIEQIVTACFEPGTSEKIRRICRICDELGAKSLNIQQLNDQITQYKYALKTKKETLSSLNSFIEFVPEAISLPIGVLRQAHKLISEFDKETIALRSELLADPTLRAMLSRLCLSGRKLCEEKENLKTIISTTATELSFSELSKYAECLKSAGLFSWLSPSFLTAKRMYMAHTRRIKFNKIDATKDLQTLATWKKAEQNFIEDQQARSLFGIHFSGIDTDFNLFEQLTKFYDNIEICFPGVENHKIRTLLKSADSDFLFSIPSIPDIEHSNTFSELNAEIQTLELSLTRRQLLIEELESLISVLVFPNNITIRQLSQIANRIDEVLIAKNNLDTNETIKAILGDKFCGSNTLYDNLAFEIKILSIFENNNKYSSLFCSLLEGSNLENFSEHINKTVLDNNRIFLLLQELEDKSGINFKTFIANCDLTDLVHFFKNAAKDKDGLYAHFVLANARTDLNNLGFGMVVAAFDEEERPFSNLCVTLEAVIYRAMMVRAYEQHGSILSRFPGSKLNSLRTELAKLDREIINLSQQHIRLKIYRAANPPLGNSKGRKSELTQLSLLINELSKKQRFIPIRDLTSRATAALLELKPCWMMSPLAVAQYLPIDTILFNLCILDEASQMPPENALGALARCSQAMVVGDTNQLPPTNFFRKIFEDDDLDEDEAVLDESILAMANTAFRPPRRLRWHYRSRHSGLIQFSNRYIYNNDLVIFPSPSEFRPDMGVSLVKVEGHYRAGINSDEATVIVKAALNFMHNDPDRSLGIVTLNQKQRDLILEEMDRALNKDTIASKYVEDWIERNDGLESFFIKNLENVQGDERDVIYIGTVYGPEKPGMPVMQRFGPVNGLAGKRRLNVLFSRAKQQIVTFSSMTAADIKADEHTNQGAYMLKCWLEYAKTGILYVGESVNREPDSDFEVYVINQLRSMGYEPVSQVGVAGYRIDIGIKHPSWPYNEYIMGVECDGATYHSSRSARDRDRLREEILTNLGWKLHRIWSTSWFTNPDKEAQRLRVAIEARLNELQNSKSGTQNNAMQYPPSFENEAKSSSPTVPTLFNEDTASMLPKVGVCPDCGKDLVVKKSRMGSRFIACTGFPSCKYTRPFSTEVPCPKCSVGSIVEKNTRKGNVFYGCDQFPRCDYALWNPPVSQSCSNCNFPILTRKESLNTTTLSCPKCGYSILAHNDIHAAGTKVEPFKDQVTEPSRKDVIEIGDTIKIRYLTGDKTIREFVLSNTMNDPDKGIVHIDTPLGQSLIDAEKNDEIEFLAGNIVRKIHIENVTKGKNALK